MKESYRKGVANHFGPESCVDSREVPIEALTGGSAGRVLSCEIVVIGVPTSFSMAEDNTSGVRNRELPLDSAHSETPRTHGNSARREPGDPSTPIVQFAAGRLEKAMRKKTSMYVDGESDGS